MNVRLSKRSTVDVVPRGPRPTAWNKLLNTLLQIKKDEVISIDPRGRNVQRVAARVRCNVSKWKKNKGLQNVTVRVTKKGHISIWRVLRKGCRAV